MAVLTQTFLVDNSPPDGLEPPRVVAPKPVNQPVAPNAIPAYDPNNPDDLKYARIGYKNLLTGGADTNQARALTPNTYERWSGASGAVSGVFNMRASDIDYIGIAAHDLFSSGASVVISTSTSTGGPYTERAAITPTNNQAIMVLLSSLAVDVVQVQITVTSSGSGFEIGVIHAGRALVMQRPLYGGHSPIDLSSDTDYQTALSDTGQYLGRTIIRQGTQTSFAWQNLDPAWYRAYFQPFVDSAKTLPFFVAWRPDKYDTAAYCHTTSDIKPRNMGGGHDLMSVSFKALGHADSIR